MEDRFKFRVWDKENREMIPCQDDINPKKEGCYVETVGPEEVKIHTYHYDNTGELIYDPEYYYGIKNYEIMQCTGLKDKDGKLIFEGDILKIDDGECVDTGIVKFGVYNKTNLGFYIDIPIYYRWARKDVIFYIEDYAIEIIGNIHENKELLKVGK